MEIWAELFNLCIQLLIVFIGGFLGAKSAKSIEIFKKEREISEKMLHEVYEPVWRILFEDYVKNQGYNGLELTQYKQIRSVLYANVSFIEPELEDVLFRNDLIMEHKELWNLVDVRIDQDKELFLFVRKKYNELRKELVLPHFHKQKGKKV
ncbi:hypothetical protein [Metabacillus arenae]|uniref:Uncharacterized protein n=1 Tax=Metabacillus arenae TaxID=2771434 RepID=A0A926RXK2_9BACI|nr:hypothetical protein [Metabacillus arenae]MBD1381076.1 hypothetical protein [Metabacillus arenae]